MNKEMKKNFFGVLGAIITILMLGAFLSLISGRSEVVVVALMSIVIVFFFGHIIYIKAKSKPKYVEDFLK